ncbi:hypothetical protein D1007_13551 [Hordeum vulgare]|nr:hypothetical protein D1007_13551 [Hordeum vulgare]
MLRRLRLTNWTLDPPWGVLVAASLETLCLTRVVAPAAVLQQLVSDCPCLADLTLEECPTATEITVSSDRLHRFTMVCCHNAHRVVLRTRRLRSLRYKGGLPSDTFLEVPDYGEVAALKLFDEMRGAMLAPDMWASLARKTVKRAKSGS